MFDRTSDNGRDVMGRARVAAARLGHGFIGPEHILLGLTEAPTGRGVTLLEKLGGEPQKIGEDLMAKLEVEEVEGTAAVGALPFTPSAKRVLEHSAEEATGMRHRHLGTEHLLLGLLHEGGGPVAQVLKENGLELDAARALVRG